MWTFTRNGKSLQNAIWQDSLTGAIDGFAFSKHGSPNRRTIDGSLSIIFIDINEFKQINDNFGHEAGDQVLKIVVEKLETVFSRKGDALVMRKGGDEFVVILPNTSLVFAKAGMKQVCKLIAPVSISYGVEFCEDFSRIAEAEQRADVKMYRMKHLTAP